MKVNLSTLTVGQGSVEVLNLNFQLIAAAFDNTLSRAGDSPNAMEADIDMDSHRLYNCPWAGSDSEPVTYGQLIAMSTPVLYAPNPHTHLWADISDKPSTFAPAAHTQATSTITGLDATLTSLDSRLDAIEAEVTIYVQATEPVSPPLNACWFW